MHLTLLAYTIGLAIVSFIFLDDVELVHSPSHLSESNNQFLIRSNGYIIPFIVCPGHLKPLIQSMMMHQQIIMIAIDLP